MGDTVYVTFEGDEFVFKKMSTGAEIYNETAK